ncbi:SICAvar, type I [Plasmodium knowlesi strain H]|uniref:SICAvar, type I n=3 Tax=Plasmodium knowlesi TaxID=5850 RepID=A0A1A7VF05_PLAKH|nr:SICAvar, type I [Plasmodium knowlesi strain H]OTN65127.1 SICAvar type I [Plasmodium knowlesi]CAA9988342.1 SICAvar, type I [Plasmodium knowlesi strain H]SBO20102.1 SICAvar, type I [Plasmodium knowlesi strain H]SBO20296.1 SICAvar, type I [Plasmodium knowlesi strain H]VVS77816.1 SICAvar, type I [Plasmodium knowlesi strain H]
MSGEAGGGSTTSLFETWMKEVLRKTQSTDPTGTAQKITDELRKDFEEAWKKLQNSLMQPGVGEIGKLCSPDFAESIWGGGKGKEFKNEYVKDLCAGLMGIRYFMSGITELGRSKVEVEAKLSEGQWLARCTVGMLALSEIYGDHCNLDRIIGKISNEVEDNLRRHNGKGMNDEMIHKCEGKVDATALLIGKSLLQDKIKQWTQQKRDAGLKGGGYRIGTLWGNRWSKVCNEGKKTPETQERRKKEYLKANASSMTKLMKLDTAQNESKVMPLSDVLIGESKDYSLDLDKLTKVFENAMQKDSTDTAAVAQAIMKEIAKESDEKLAENCIKNTLDDKGGKDNALCKRLDCMKYLWQNVPSGVQGTNEDFWDSKVKALWKELSDVMVKANGNADGNCGQVNDNGTLRQATPSEKTACNYLHAGLNELYNPTTTSSPTGDENNILSTKNSLFRQTMGCFLLHAYAKHIKKNATCIIDNGIERAFDLGKKLSDDSNGNCSGGKGPCVPCQWNDTSMENCTVQTGTQEAGIPGDKVEGIFKKDEDQNISTMLTAINKMNKLCDYMECIASHLNSPNGKQSAEKFWTTTGEVGQLWGELQGAMMEESVNGQCDKMDNGSRPATKPEKKACQHLTKFFTKLKDITTSKGTDNKIFDEHPSLKRAMGCFLLHAYAKKMKKDAKCEIEAGIKKAFDTAGKGLSDNCNGSGGTEPCVPCEWNEKDYESCEIHTNGNKKEKVEEKLDKVKKRIEGTTTAIVNGMNETKSLCDQLQCAAGKWFNEHSKGSTGSGTATPKKTWCQFWNEGVRPTLQTMFQHIEKNNANNTNSPCDQFGDENADSVERRACNHITAGLDYIKNSTSSGNGNPLLDRAVGCIALNLYADQIITKSEDSCPIDKDKISKMFEEWNKKNSCSVNGGGNNNCFQCIRQPKFNNCQLSVDSNLINTPSQSNGNCNTDATEAVRVKDQMNKFLNEDPSQSQSPSQSILEVNTTLTTITDITKSPLCTQLQCAAKKWNSTEGKSGKPTWQNLWTKDGEVEQLWTQLSEAMKTNSGTDTNGNQCAKMDDGTPNGQRDATNPEKKACNYLHAGLTALYKTNGATAPSPSSGDEKILDKNLLLRQTVGCILLKEYAKKMKEESTCVIQSGIKKAFGSWGPITNANCSGGTEPCVPCQWNDDSIDKCELSIIDAAGGTTQMKVADKLKRVKSKMENEVSTTLTKINEMTTLCEYIRCAAPKWFKNRVTTSGGTSNPAKNWCDFWEEVGVKPELKTMFQHIESEAAKKVNNSNTTICQQFGDGNSESVERKACNHITAGLDYIKKISSSTTTKAGHQDDDKFFKQSMMCAALNLYATKIRKEMENSCPIDETKIEEMFDKWNKQNNNSSCNGVRSVSNNGCFLCSRQNEDFKKCELSVPSALVETTKNGQNCTDNATKVETKMDVLLKDEDTTKIKEKLSHINKMDDNFCTQLQCAAKQFYVKKKKGKSSEVNWNALMDKIGKELTALLNNMNNATKQSAAEQYCNDANVAWSTKGHTERRTNRAACLHFAAGLQHIYGRPNGPKLGPVNGPSFAQTMGCLFLKEYAKQLKDLANKKKQGNSWVHPLCDIKEGIDQAFEKSKDIMEASPLCNKNGSTDSCFVCTQEEDYNNCKIGDDDIGSKSNELFKNESKQDQMEKTLENTVCPILLTDLLTPFLPLAPVSIGLSAMAYYLWKYFGPPGKGGARFRRSPTEIPGPSVQEHLLDHVEEAGPHEYRLVKERKPRSAPTRTKRSGRDPAGGGRVNRRTIIEIHFEVLDECQKGDTQLNQKDFLELLIQEFMGSALMEEEQVPKEEVLMEPVPMELVPIEEVHSLGFVV